MKAGHHLQIRDSIGSLLVLAIILVMLLLLKYRSEELWKDMPSRVFHNQMVNSSLLHRRPKTPEMLECSSNATCIPPPPPPSWFFNYLNKFDGDKPEPESCPFYFKWIVADLWPWKDSGITLQMVEEAKPLASFRLMIVDGRLFAEIYQKCFQTRDYFTIWAFSQLLKLYPGMVPDLDLMFNCEDRPLVTKFDYKNNHTRKNPSPMFRYCGHPDFYDIVFPDWSYWGWPEVRSEPWEILLREIRNGSQEVQWVNRNPVAYWRGNPAVAKARMALLECSKIPNWNGQVIAQDWNKEISQGFKDSKLSEQCKHRYKIYIEGKTWSVSMKNIMACNSPTLLIRPQYYEFFQRGLVAHKHYLPVSSEKMCDSVNTTVNWGNSNIEEAMAIGNAGSDFLLNEVKMKHVYDYMFHVLTQYAKLLKYKPSVSENSVEYCSEAMMCFANEVEKQYMKDTLITTRSPSPPCNIGDVQANIKEIKEFAEQNKETQFNVQWMEEK
ncbi:uncharacterized protein LOC131039621 [Cryptomeria japonica]|uniref:uncharacterized protein LOC131039621 n=1 Tax=Cryptomeria japonica TaxID=3369 RepID=UPI0027DA1803|nr:uncharacterized protein LOC131039621 [Cryptomeria japonica]